MTAGDLVVDASVAIKLFVDEDLSEHAARLFLRLAGTPPALFYVPDLLFPECANILWKYVLRFGYDAGQARESLTALRQLPLQSIVAAELLEATFDLAVGLGITAYDACYLALAKNLKLPFVTADQRLSRKVEGSGLDVRWLGDL